MDTFYVCFFIRQLIVLLIFLSNIEPKIKILTMALIDEFGGHLPFYKYKNLLSLTDKVIIMDTIGSMFCYFQIMAVIIENKLLSKNHILMLMGALVLHILSILNYLKNEALDKRDKYIIPDLFKIVLLGSFLVYK
jgi:hypothetical protein